MGKSGGKVVMHTRHARDTSKLRYSRVWRNGSKRKEVEKKQLGDVLDGRRKIETNLAGSKD